MKNQNAEICYLKCLIQKMNNREDSQSSTAEEETLRHRLLPLFILNSPSHNISFSLLEVILDIFNYLQLMKFPIDYYSNLWTGNYLCIFTYIDPAYYISNMNEESKGNVVIAGIVLMNFYTLTLFSLYFFKIEYQNWMAGVRKILFLVYRHFLLIPFFRIIIRYLNSKHSFFQNCTSDSIFRFCIPHISFVNIAIFVVSFAVFLAVIGCQSFFNFEFLPKNKNYVRLRKSSHTPLIFYLYFILSELTIVILQDLAQLAALNLFTILVIIFVLWKDEQVQEKAKLIEYSCLGSIMTGFLIVDAMELSNLHVELYVYVIICAALISGILQLKPYSIRFELENINKWPTQQIMIKQESTIRYYLSRGSEYLFKIWIYGYMEIHRQKCDSITCPSRVALSERDQKVLAECDYPKIQEQLVRINNIMKVIFTAGYKLNPVPGEIQLQYCRYAYERKEYEIALRRLLVIDFSELTLDKYYEYKYLKEILSTLIKNSMNEEFLDFVTEMALKREEEQIMIKFQKAAFLNLEFWSILNDDHPDFEKLNEVATARIQIAKSINKQFKSITSYAHSQKITTLYSYYLECLENDELMHHDIYQNLRKDFQLDRRTFVRDWSNSSTNVALASLQEINFGKIIQINASCAALFGYEKHELINQPLSNLLPEDLRKSFPIILNSNTNEDTFLLVHKNSYLIAVHKTAKHYNSMSTGATALITFQIELTPFSCQLMIDKNNKIIAQSASMISVLGLDLKSFEGQSYSYQFFTKNLIEADEKEKYKAKDIIKTDFLVNNYYKEREFQIRVFDQYECKIVEIRDSESKEEKKVLKKVKKADNNGNFQFQVEATSNEFKYIGKSNNEESFISQFSQSQYRHKQETEEFKINYAANISTLRLKDGAIQYIEENQEANSQQFIKQEESSAANLVAIARKDEEEIFQSKQSYQKFLQQNKVGKSIYIILASIIVVVFGLYILTHVLQKGDLNTAEAYSTEAIIQNKIISHIELGARCIHDMYLLAQNKSGEVPSFFRQAFEHVFVHLQEIMLDGSAPYPLTFTVDDSTTTYLTNQYLSTLINYATGLLSRLESVTTNDELKNVLDTEDNYTLHFLLSPNVTAVFMKKQYDQRQEEMISDLNQRITVQKALISVGFASITILSIILFYALNVLNIEKAKVLQIFLDISEIQIQHFSSKTEKFLIFLHSEETNTDIQQEVEHKKLSSSFSKKKSFKYIKANFLLYIKISIVMVIMTFFFVHSYIVAVSESEFQVKSISFDSQVAKMMSVFSNTKDALLMHSLYGVEVDYNGLALSMLEQNRNYLSAEEQSFGHLSQFEDLFQFVLRGDICQGFESVLGFINIPESCNLDYLNKNGTFLIFMHLFNHVQNWNEVEMIEEGDHNNHVLFQVLIQAQDLLCQFIIEFQNNLITQTKNQLLSALLLWMGLSALAALLIWGREIGNFLLEINQTRIILGILPLKMVKESHQALKYVKENLEQSV